MEASKCRLVWLVSAIEAFSEFANKRKSIPDRAPRFDGFNEASAMFPGEDEPYRSGHVPLAPQGGETKLGIHGHQRFE
jgi:hypothetical protein